MPEPIVMIENVQVETKITKDDLISIKVVQHEQKLTASKEKLERELNAANSQISEIKEAVQRMVDKEAHAKFSGQLLIAEDSLTKIGYKVKTNLNVLIITNKSFDIENINVKLSISLDPARNYRHDTDHKLQVKPEYIEAFNSIKRLNDISEQLTKEIVRIRSELNNIPSMERKFRASFAMNILNGSESGRALVDKLNDSDGLMLPMES